jgi:hypothetical protein
MSRGLVVGGAVDSRPRAEAPSRILHRWIETAPAQDWEHHSSPVWRAPDFTSALIQDHDVTSVTPSL